MLTGKLTIWDSRQIIGVTVEFEVGGYRIFIDQGNEEPLLLASGRFADRSDRVLDNLDRVGEVLDKPLAWALKILQLRGRIDAPVWEATAKELLDRAGKLIKVVSREDL